MKKTVGFIAYRRTDGSFFPAIPIQKEFPERMRAEGEEDLPEPTIPDGVIDSFVEFFTKAYDEHLCKKRREEERQRQLRLERAMLAGGIRELGGKKDE